MKWHKFSLATILLALVMVLPSVASAQVGLEEGTMLRAQRQHTPAMLVFSSDIDTIATTASDTTGIMYIAGYTVTDPRIIYTMTGTITSVGVRQQFSPSANGPWVTAATDSILSASTGTISVAEGSDYQLPYFRLIIAGSDFPVNDSQITALYCTWTINP